MKTEITIPDCNFCDAKSANCAYGRLRNLTSCHDTVLAYYAKPLYDVRYLMDICGGGDVWRIHGKYNGKYICPSFPVMFDEENDYFQTVSGSIYKIMSYNGDKRNFVHQIEKDMEKGGFEIH